MKRFYFILLISTLALLIACSAESPIEEESVNKLVGKEELNHDESGGIDKAKVEELRKQFPSEVPERIITTSVPLTEMFYLLGIRPVGVPTSTNPIPADFDEIEKIGSPMQPDLEVVTNLEPDLIVGAESLRSTLEKNLEGIDLKPMYLPTESFDDLKLSFEVLGTYFGKEEEMNEILDSIEEKESLISELAKNKEFPSVMLMIGTSDDFMVMSERSYLGSLVKKLGADNIATSKLQVKDTYSPINLEDVVAADPDIILVLASGDHGASEDMFEKEIANHATWKKLSAYKNENIHMLENDIFGVTSILNVEQALMEIANYFYE